MTEPQEQTINIGQRLSLQREKLSFSQEEVAKKLYLPVRIIAAIENNLFTEGPGLVFMRGYLQAYVRLLGLAEQSIMIEFDMLDLKDDDKRYETITVPIVYDGKRSLAQHVTRWVSVLIVIGLLVLVFMWWGESQGTDDTEAFSSITRATDNDFLDMSAWTSITRVVDSDASDEVTAFTTITSVTDTPPSLKERIRETFIHE